MSQDGGWKFGWKRKIGADVSKSASTAFEEETKNEDEAFENEDVDWLTLLPAKRSCVVSLEDSVNKASRLTQEGTVLADAERYWEAIKKWDEALQYTPGEAKLHEMKAQALMELNEVYPAVEAAQKAAQYSPTWWVAHQTHGRALLGLGEVRQAIRSFSQAVHLNPANEELREEDLMWAQSLLEKRKALDAEKRAAEEREKLLTKSSLKIREIDSEEDGEEEGKYEEEEDRTDKTVDVYRPTLHPSPVISAPPSTSGRKRRHKVPKLPSNFVQMRDPV